MKIIVRSFVVALALTGVIASTSANGSSTKSIKAVGTTAFGGPSPDCAPGDGAECGWPQ